MFDLQLPDSGKKIRLRSYLAREQAVVDEAHSHMVQGDISLYEFRKKILELVYPDLKAEEMTAADLAYLTTTILKYAAGGPEAVKNSLMSGSGTTETA